MYFIFMPATTIIQCSHVENPCRIYIRFSEIKPQMRPDRGAIEPRRYHVRPPRPPPPLRSDRRYSSHLVFHFPGLTVGNERGRRGCGAEGRQ